MNMDFLESDNMQNIGQIVVLSLITLIWLWEVDSNSIFIGHATGLAFITGAIFQTIYLILQGELKC